MGMIGTPTKTKNQLWEFTCVPECGFMVREHNQKALVQEANTHARMVHPDMKPMADQQVLGMAKKI